MSAALVRQALEFVDQDSDKNIHKKRRRPTRYSGDTSQGFSHPYVRKNEKARTKKLETVNEIVEKLLVLSTPVTEKTVAEKIVKRAIKGKPLLEKIEVKKVEEKSILFPEESFKDFEETYFCS